MESPFHSKHPARMVQKDISHICAPLFAKLGLNYLHYCKMYLDGSTTMLFSRLDWSDYFFEKELKADMALPDAQSVVIGKPNLSLWKGTGSESYLADATNLFDMHHPLAINTLYDDHLESIVIALDYAHKDCINNYFMNIELMLLMLEEIKEKCKPIVEELEKMQVIYPESRRPEQLKLVDNVSDGIMLNLAHGLVKLSYKELDILQQLRFGLDVPEIAKKLHRSRRTIETHISNIRQKLNCKKRSELILLALRLGVIR